MNIKRWSLAGFQADDRTAQRCAMLLAAFYGYVAAFALTTMTGYQRLIEGDPVKLLWPLWWARSLPWEPVAVTIVVALVLTALLALVRSQHQWPRVAVFVTLLFYVAGVNSFGKINHGLHHLLIVAFFLALIPSRIKEDQGGRLYGILLAAQAVVLSTYTLSGLFKLLSGLEQLRAGEASIFGGASLAAIVADRALQTAENPPLANLIIEYPALSSLLYLAAVFVELAALPTLVVPRLAGLWALALMSFHLAVFWSMHIGFSASIAVLAILFLLSPFLISDRVGPDAADVLDDGLAVEVHPTRTLQNDHS